MEPQTRALLQLLALENTDRLLELLQDGPREEAHLVEHVGSNQQTVNRLLNRLEQWAIVQVAAGDQEPRDKRGPRPRSWSLAGDEVIQFGNAADALALGLMESRAKQMRTALARRRRSQVRETKRAV